MRALLVYALAGLFGDASTSSKGKSGSGKSGWTCPTGSRTGSGPEYHYLTHNNIVRCWLQYVPPDVSEPLPLVIDMHPLQATASMMFKADGFAQLAQAEGFIAVWPNGFRRSWNSGGVCCGAAVFQNIDDIGFLTALISTLRTQLNIDPTRIYATGHSNGCGMAQRLAVERSNLVTAVACMSGFWTARYPEAKHGTLLPVPFMAVHCRDDTTSPARYDPLARKNLHRWRVHNGCVAEPLVKWQNATSTYEAYEECDHGTQVGLVTLEMCGHWPYKNEKPFGMPVGRKHTLPHERAEDAVAMSWDFMRQFRLVTDGSSRRVAQHAVQRVAAPGWSPRAGLGGNATARYAGASGGALVGAPIAQEAVAAHPAADVDWVDVDVSDWVDVTTAAPRTVALPPVQALPAAEAGVSTPTSVAVHKDEAVRLLHGPANMSARAGFAAANTSLRAIATSAAAAAQPGPTAASAAAAAAARGSQIAADPNATSARRAGTAAQFAGAMPAGPKGSDPASAHLPAARAISSNTTTSSVPRPSAHRPARAMRAAMDAPMLEAAVPVLR